MAAFIYPARVMAPDDRWRLDGHRVVELGARTRARRRQGHRGGRDRGHGAAIAGAVYHATGIRVRDLPIRPGKLLRSKP